MDGDAEETITVGTTSAGPGASGSAGEPVELPIVELLTGRAFLTGKSGSGKSNSASVVAENLLDAGHPLMIVDTDGEYYGLKEAYELLHVGADEECDIQVTADHASKLAELALEEGVPIILDVSGYLDEAEANDLLTAVARHLFAKAKKLKRPFLLLVEEIHEYVPEGGLDECGRMLVKISKRGRKHGLGIVGISQRPADVKKDFITQCDWLCWHRLTWRNDTRVVKRVLGSEYADAVEDLDDGEAFLVTDWSPDVRRVQFDRKETFDAGATPGLEDFERPDLKSVSADLVDELEAVSEAHRRRENRVEQLEAELAAREERIRELERELEEARDLSRMAEQFVAALDGVGTDHGDSPEVGDGATDDRDVENAVDGGETEVPGDADDIGADATAATGDGSAGSEPMPDARGLFGNDAAASRTDLDAAGTNAGDARGSTPETDGTAAPPGVAAEGPPRRPVERDLRAALSEADAVTRGMLAHYRAAGPCDPVDAHVAAGGDGDRTAAYRRNRQLREAGAVRHAGRGRYAYALPERVCEAHDGRLGEADRRAVVERIERAVLPDDYGHVPGSDPESGGERGIGD